MPHRTLNTDELADYLHITPGEVERLLRETDIPHTTRGARIVFQRGDIDAWASRRLLGLPDRRLDEYHVKTMRGTQDLFPERAVLPQLLQPAHIDLALPAKTRASVLRDMVDLAARTDRVFDPRELLDSVTAREQLTSTGLPGGLALLHARHHDAYRFDGSFIVLGRTIQSVPFGAPDGKPTRLFFLVCCQDHRIHLHTLARLCLLALKTDIVTTLLDAPDAETAHAQLLQAETAALAATPAAT